MLPCITVDWRWKKKWLQQFLCSVLMIFGVLKYNQIFEKFKKNDWKIFNKQVITGGIYLHYFWDLSSFWRYVRHLAVLRGGGDSNVQMIQRGCSKFRSGTRTIIFLNNFHIAHLILKCIFLIIGIFQRSMVCNCAVELHYNLFLCYDSFIAFLFFIT